MYKKNSFKEIDVNLKNNYLILSFESTKLDDWIKYDSRSLEEKAIFMYRKGKKINNIAKRLHVSIKQVITWTLNIYEKSPVEFKCKSNKLLKTPKNFSSWNSLNIYNFWNSFNTRQKNRDSRLQKGCEN